MKNRLLVCLMLFLFAATTFGCARKEAGREEKKEVTKEGVITLNVEGEELTISDIESRQLNIPKPDEPVEAKEFEEFVIYRDKRYMKNHYIPSGWMGDVGDIKFNDSYKDNTQSGYTCIEVGYTGKYSQNAGWSGVYWQHPANNWGMIKGGYDLTGATKLTFWARGKEGGEVISEFKMGGISGEYSDSDSASIGPIELTGSWKQYTIDLEGMDLSYINGGFCWVISKIYNDQGCTFYLDEIKYE